MLEDTRARLRAFIGQWYTGKTCSIILDSGVCSVFIREYALRLGSMILKASISWRR